MPEFASVSPNLEATGPTIEVEVRVSSYVAKALFAQRRPVPPPVVVNAIIDTGATWCVFTPDIFAQLQIEPFDVATISTASSPRHEQNLYNIDLMFGRHRVHNVSACEAPLSGAPVQGLIGRNVLKYGTLLYDGRINSYVLSLY